MKELLAVFVAMVLGMIAWSKAAPMLHDAELRPVQNQSAALHAIFTESSETYLRSYFSAVLSAAQGGGVVEITPAMLQATEMLEDGFVDANFWQQSHRLLVKWVSGTQVMALAVTCGPSAIPEKELFRLAPLAGRHGGQISSADPAYAVAADGGWKVALASYAGVTDCPLVQGALVNRIALDNGAVLPPYLVRNLMPEFGTEPQTMGTTLYMADNEIQGAHDVGLSNGKWVSNGLFDVDIVQDGASVAKPTCPHGNPAIVVLPAVFSDEGIGRPLVAVQPYAVDAGSSWTVHYPIYTVNDSGTGSRQVPSGAHARAGVITKCQ